MLGGDTRGNRFSPLPAVQSVEALLAESVGTVEPFGSVEVQVEAVVAYFALVFLAGKRVGHVRRNGATVVSCIDRLRHVPSYYSVKIPRAYRPVAISRGKKARLAIQRCKVKTVLSLHFWQ